MNDVRDRSSFASWMKYRTVRHSNLVCPTRVLWRDYRAYCIAWGFCPMSAHNFKDELEDEAYIEVKDSAGRGRLKSMVDGIGIIPTPITDTHQMPDVMGRIMEC